MTSDQLEDHERWLEIMRGAHCHCSGPVRVRELVTAVRALQTVVRNERERNDERTVELFGRVKMMGRRATRWKRVATEYKQRYRLRYATIEELRLSPEVAECLVKIRDEFNEINAALTAEHRDALRVITELANAVLAVKVACNARIKAIALGDTGEISVTLAYNEARHRYRLDQLLDAYEQRKREAGGA